MFNSYKKGWKYTTTEEVVYDTGWDVPNAILTPFIELTLCGRLTISKGYSFDGASGAIDTDTVMKGALLHDSCYQLLRGGKLPQEYRKKADKLFYKVNVEEGMFEFRAMYMYLAVRAFGWKFSQ